MNGDFLFDPDDWAERLCLNTGSIRADRAKFTRHVADAIAQRDRAVIAQALTKVLLGIDDTDGVEEVRDQIRARIGGLS